jgi:hypothetical protein
MPEYLKKKSISERLNTYGAMNAERKSKDQRDKEERPVHRASIDRAERAEGVGFEVREDSKTKIRYNRVSS